MVGTWLSFTVTVYEQVAVFPFASETVYVTVVTPTLKNDSVTLSAPNFDSIQFVIQKSGMPTPVNIWKSKGVSAIDQGDETAQWFSDRDSRA